MLTLSLASKVQKSFFMSKLPLRDIRKDYRMASLNERDVSDSPFPQFEKWFADALHGEVGEPSAMTLATTSPDGHPSARIVLLKGFDTRGFYFYTNYESKKALQIAERPFGALVFFWKELERQIRVEGMLSKTNAQQSDDYFQSRPLMSRIGAWASPQSQAIPNRNYLEERLRTFEARFKDHSVDRPEHWGGYLLEPTLLEFWQGRSNRLHDRIQYTLQAGGQWKMERLAP